MSRLTYEEVALIWDDLMIEYFNKVSLPEDPQNKVRVLLPDGSVTTQLLIDLHDTMQKDEAHVLQCHGWSVTEFHAELERRARELSLTI